METLSKLESNIKIMSERIEDYKILRQEYFSFLQTLNCDIMPINKQVPKIIWSCWFQGIENMPPLVRVCYNELTRRFKDYKHILITEKNIEQYVTIEDNLIQKWHNKNIPNTAFSNLIRLYLLEKYGGIWVDSTVLFTGEKLPCYITENPLFMYSSWSWITGDVRPISTWLISACPNYPLIKIVKSLLMKYWFDKDYLQTYFIFHMFFRLALEIYPHLLDYTPKVSNIPPHFMQFELPDRFSSKRFYELKNMSPLHKLTYKLSPEVLLSKNTLYAYLINQRSNI